MSEFEDDQKGQNAQALLNDPLLQKALIAARAEIMSTWESAPSRDTDGREWLWMLHQASLRFEGILRGYIDTGKIAKANLKPDKPIMQRIRSIM